MAFVVVEAAKEEITKALLLKKMKKKKTAMMATECLGISGRHTDHADSERSQIRTVLYCIVRHKLTI